MLSDGVQALTISRPWDNEEMLPKIPATPSSEKSPLAEFDSYDLQQIASENVTYTRGGINDDKTD
jgi:hypothetical protein